MNLKQSNTLQSLKELQKFLDEHPAELPGISETGMRKKFDDIIEELTKLGAAQTAADLAAMSTTRKVYALTQELIAHHMSHVSRIAAIELPPGPELAPLAMPRATLTGERLAARARGMATEAQKYESTFIAAGLPQDFVKQLNDSADSLSTLLTARKQHLAVRGAATKLLGTHLKEARKMVKVLDGFVKTTGKDNPKLLVTWKIVKRWRQATIAPTPAGAPPFDAVGGAE